MTKGIMQVATIKLERQKYPSFLDQQYRYINGGLIMKNCMSLAKYQTHPMQTSF